MSHPRSSVRTFGISKEESRLKREAQTLTLRKKERDQMLKRRRGNIEASSEVSLPSNEDKTVIEAILYHKERILSDDLEKVKQSCQEFRKLLSDENNPPIDQVINAGVVPRFIECILSQDEMLQYEALWCLTNIASGSHEHTQYLVSLDFIPKVLELTTSPNPKVVEQATWLIGNIAGDCTEYRDYILSLDGMSTILKILQLSNLKVTLVRVVMWTLSNLCRGHPPPSFSITKEAVPYACKLIFSTDREILVDALWTLSFLSDGKPKKQRAVIKYNVCHRLITLLRSNDLHFVIPASRIIGNLLSGDHSTTETVIEAGVLPALKNLLSHEEWILRKEACWGLSNILAGTSKQIQNVIEEDIIPILLHILDSDIYEVRKEAAWCLSNGISEAEPHQIVTFANFNCLQYLCGILKYKDVKLVLMTLEAIEKSLKVGEMIASNKNIVNPYLDIIYSCGGLETIEALMNDSNDKVSRTASKIVQKYFRKPMENIQYPIDQDSYNFQVEGQNQYEI